MKIVPFTCTVCGRGHDPVHVPEADYWKWQAGEDIETAMPSVSVADREVLITGTHSECFEFLCVEYDEEDDDGSE